MAQPAKTKAPACKLKQSVSQSANPCTKRYALVQGVLFMAKISRKINQQYWLFTHLFNISQIFHTNIDKIAIF